MAPEMIVAKGLNDPFVIRVCAFVESPHSSEEIEFPRERQQQAIGGREAMW
jgi:hypothetical protein